MGQSGCWAAVQYAFNPLLRNSLTAIHSPQKSTTDGGVGIGISSTHDGVHHPSYLLVSLRFLSEILILFANLDVCHIR